MTNVVLAAGRLCEWCDTELVRKRYGTRGSLEAFADFAARKFCSDPCARKAQRVAAESKGTCTAPECTVPAKHVGLCVAHYHRLNRHGDPTAGGPARIYDLETRLWSQIDKDGPIPTYRPDLGPCWIWTGGLNNKGYGLVTIDSRKRAAHVVVYEVVIGPVPDGLELDHLCRVKACCRPGAHTEPVTHAENQRRASEALTHCRRAGHPRTVENTYRSPSTGRRSCRACARERGLESRARSKDGAK